MASFIFLAVVRWLHFGALTTLFGASLFSLYARSAKPALLYRAAAGVAALSGLGWAGATLVSVAGTPESLLDGATLSAFFFETQFGEVWLIRGGLLAGLLAAAFALPGPERALALLMLAGALLITQAWLGHAAAGPVLAIASYAVHVLAAGAWIGGLAGLVLLMRAARRIDENHKVERALQRFSLMGMAAVALILASGILNSLLRLSSLHTLFASLYGLTLLVKIALVAAMAALAVQNRFRLMPELDREGAGRAAVLSRLLRNVVLEQVLGAGVLAAASLLGILSPPG